MRNTAGLFVLIWTLSACGSDSDGGGATAGSGGGANAPTSGAGMSSGGMTASSGATAGGTSATTGGAAAGELGGGAPSTSAGAPPGGAGSENTGGVATGTAGSTAGGMLGGSPAGAGSPGSAGAPGTGGSGGAGGSNATTPDAACVEMVDAAKAFLQSLEAAKRTTASLPWEGTKRLAFEFLPPTQAPREGLTLKGLAAAQRTAFESFLQKAMSMPGYTKTERIRELETALGTPPLRDPENYFISFFGEPNATASTPWGFRFEGHHISIHTSVVACKTYSATPAFWGASGYTTAAANPLASEESLARTLFDSLTAPQKAEAARGATGISAIEDKQRKTAPYPADSGIAASAFSAAQKETLRQLLNAYVGNMAAPIAAQRLQAIETAGIDSLRFVYGSGGYYRVQGPTFVVVFAPDGANHIHSVWRDFDGDWGEDLLARHLELMHSGPSPAAAHVQPGSSRTPKPHGHAHPAGDAHSH